MKKVYITGADRGLGFAFVNKFLKEGYKVFAGRYLEEWDDLVELKKEYPDVLKLIPLDVGEDNSVKKAAQKIKQKTDSLDILINNAGIFYDENGDIFEKLDFEIMKDMFNVNALGPLRVTNSVIDLLIKGQDKILVNISSEAGSCGEAWRKMEYGYCMSKTAVNKQSVILQNHLKDYGIKVFAIHPGYLKSYMLGEKNMEADVEPNESAKKIYDLIKSKDKLEEHIYYDYLGEELEW